MKANLQRAPWYEGEPTVETIAALELLSGTWREAAMRFTSIREIRMAARRPEPMGIQTFLNQVLDEKFKEAGWDGSESRYRLRDTWFRVTFRHQMGLGSDLLDATRLSALEGVKQCVILGAPLNFLKVISPKDAGSLSSFEKIAFQVARLDGAVAPPLLVGSLIPESKIPANVYDQVFGKRLKADSFQSRDLY